MKVSKVNVYVVETGSYRPVVVEVLTDEGVSGIGEAAVGFGIGANAAATMAADLADAFLIGKDPFRIMDFWNDCYYDTFWGKGAGAIFYAGVSALEMALWDLKGKALKIPVYEFLGGKQRDVLQVYANDWCFEHSDPSDLARRATEVVGEGYRAIKLYPLGKVGEGSTVVKHIKNREVCRTEEKRCLEAVRAVRTAIGDDVELLIDVTAEGTPDMMIRIGQKIEEFAPYYYEEALDLFDVDSYRLLRQKVNLPLAAGERLYTRYGFRPLIENRYVDIVQPDPGTCGGIMEAWRIASMAETYQMRIAPHNCGGPILTAACVQISACVGNFAMQEVFPYRPQIHYDIVDYALEHSVKNGMLSVPDRPGLGVSLNHKTVDPFLVYSRGN